MTTTNQTRYVLVWRKTRLEELVGRFNTWPQAQFYLEHNQADPSDYLAEHDLYRQRVQEIEQVLKARGRFQSLSRQYLPSFQFGPDDVVVVIGQDGLVANTLKYLDGQPVIAINPDPQRWDGILLPFETKDLNSVISTVSKGQSTVNEITFAQARTNDGQTLLAINDLFIGPKSHTSARYSLTWDGQTEQQSSSGIIVSTGFGSTGWFASVLAGAVGVMKETGTQNHPLQGGFDWSAPKLQFAVREPFPSRTSSTSLVFGEVSLNKPLSLESMMPENGVIFSDGVENDYLLFNSGCRVTIGLAEKRGRLVTG
ncbi:sugar kinase [Amphritea sp.]|uniref:sugar kinase n=1 Tax=Amphritea sp. TaxID=1872502 RepID=UPI003D0C77EF